MSRADAFAGWSAVVFDLDGTLIDSIPDVVGAVNRLLAEEGRRPITLGEGRLMVGGGARPLVAAALRVTGATPDEDVFDGLIARYLEFYKRYPAVDTSIYPHVEDTLGQLRDNGIRLGICTNKPHDMSLLVLDELNLSHFFDATIGGDALAVKKPDPAHLTAVFDRLETDPSHSVYVGDSPTDSATARAAGVPFVGVSYGYSGVPPEQMDVDILIDSFADLPASLARLVSVRHAST